MFNWYLWHFSISISTAALELFIVCCPWRLKLFVTDNLNTFWLHKFTRRIKKPEREPEWNCKVVDKAELRFRREKLIRKSNKWEHAAAVCEEVWNKTSPEYFFKALQIVQTKNHNATDYFVYLLLRYMGTVLQCHGDIDNHLCIVSFNSCYGAYLKPWNHLPIDL